MSRKKLHILHTLHIMHTMEVRLTLKEPEESFVQREMYDRRMSARAYALFLIQAAMKRAARNAPELIRKSRRP
jgi:hypothetical protein